MKYVRPRPITQPVTPSWKKIKKNLVTFSSEELKKIQHVLEELKKEKK